LASENGLFNYQLKNSGEKLNYHFEPLGSIHRNGLSVALPNYDLVYTVPLTENDSLESFYIRFNMNRPEDFTGYSLFVSDTVVLHQDGKGNAHYCDRFGFFMVSGSLQEQKPELILDVLCNFYMTVIGREQI